MTSLRQDAQPKPARPPGDGWKTAAQLCSAENLSRPHCNSLLRQCLAEGSWERRMFPAFSVRGNYPTPHYRPKKKPKTRPPLITDY